MEVKDHLEIGTKMFNLHQLNTLPVSASQVQKATLKDPQLRSMMRYTREGWPDQVPVAVAIYMQCQSELGTEAGFVFWGMSYCTCLFA